MFADTFDLNAKSDKARGWFYFTVNSLYSASFALYTFGVWQDSCWTVNGTDTPVTKETEGAVNTTKNWNLIMSLAFVVYAIAACASVSQCFNGKVGQVLQKIEKYVNYMCVAMFIVLHIMRWTHSGAVCAGDYLTTEQIEAGQTQGYLIGTGQFLVFFIIVGWVMYPVFLLANLIIFGPNGQTPAMMLDAPK